MNRKQLILAVATVTMILSAVSHAEESGFFVTPSIGFIDYEKDRANDPKIGGELEDDLLWSLGLGYRFDNPWAVELVYQIGETEVLSAFPKTDVDIRALHLDALYHIENDTRIAPYVAFGIGHVDLTSEASPLTKHENNLNAGGGFKYQLNDCITARSDFRVIRASDDAHIDMVFSLGLQLMLGARGGQCALIGNGGADVTPIASVAAPDMMDADQDGVADADDSCPITPVGIQVGANGCALDDDGDKVPNHRDNCPGSTAGSLVDANGCYVMLEVDKEIKLKVNFANNSDEVTPQYYDEIKRVADFMKKYPNSKVVIEGHTDSSGPASYNQQLSDRRATAVASTLSERFDVDRSRVASEGHGEAKPLANNETAEGRAANRRVVAVVSATVEKRAESE